jgi:phenylalanyl-tRNA synthetase beta chain
VRPLLGRVVRGVDTKAKTPAWMVDRLARCGQRSVTALVDISNYVMFEYGRPSHIFDLDKIHDKLVVRWGRAGETLKLLNGNTIEVDEQVGVIADARRGIAGRHHGRRRHRGVGRHAQCLRRGRLLVARGGGRPFAPLQLQHRRRHRFERGVDPALTVEHIERITQLIIDICGGEAGPMDDQVLALPPATPVTLRVARAAKVIGMPVTQAQCAEVFQRLGLSFTEAPAR